MINTFIIHLYQSLLVIHVNPAPPTVRRREGARGRAVGGEGADRTARGKAVQADPGLKAPGFKI